MSIEFNCPSCQKTYRVKEEYAGRRMRCKACEAAITVPDEFSESLPAQSPRREQQPPPLPSSGSSSKGRTNKKHKAKKTRSNSNIVYWVIGGFVGVGGLVFLLCLGVLGIIGSMKEKLQEGVAQLEEVVVQGEVQRDGMKAVIPPPGDPLGPFPIADYPLPEFPELGNPVAVPNSTVQLHRIRFSNPQQHEQPAFNMQMNIYIPAGEHDAASLPLVLVAPAGTPLFYGNSLDGDDYHDETLPYAEAGAVVIQYSLDGALADSDNASDLQVAVAYRKFRNACAGLVNARCAIEYAIKQIPGVDEQRIICAGHSSAGTLAALLAENESRIAACITYCPCIDVEKWCKPVADAVGSSPMFSKMPEFLKQSSPNNHVNRIQCPVFLFHSKDDSVSEYAESLEFQRLLKQFDKDETFSKPDAFGDHYQPMIDEGIPRAIAWLKSRELL